MKTDWVADVLHIDISLAIATDAGAPVSVEVDSTYVGIPVPLSRGLTLKGELRTTTMEGLKPGTRVLSLFIVNERTSLEADRDLNFVFQVRLALHYPPGFVCRPNRRGEAGTDEDQRVLALTFRNHMEWAVGHNTSEPNGP